MNLLDSIGIEECEYCFKTIKECNCAEEIYNNQFLEQEEEIFDYLHR